MKNQGGFTIFTLIGLLVLAGVIFGGYKFIAAVQADNKKQSEALTDAVGGGEQKNDESDDDFVPDTPGSGMQDRDIREVGIVKNAIHVVFKATLPGPYTGNCYVEMSLPDGSMERRYTEPIDGNKCEITVPVENFRAGTTWEYEYSFQSSDGRAYGRYPVQTFEIAQ